MNSSTHSKQELHAIIHGRVQGVGFRWTVVDYAERLHLTGTTRNLADGSVEIYAQGSRDSLDAFLDELKKDPGLARIESVKTDFREPANGYEGFKIVY